MHWTQQFKFCVFRKGMILPKREDGFLPEREDLPFLEVTAKLSTKYGRFQGLLRADKSWLRSSSKIA